MEGVIKIKKTNPRRRPATQADVLRAKNEAIEEAVHLASAIFLTVLVDKFNAHDYIADIWNEVNKLSEEISESRVSVSDLTVVLKEEYDIIL